jgi:hypothetical protein
VELYYNTDYFYLVSTLFYCDSLRLDVAFENVRRKGILGLLEMCIAYIVRRISIMGAVCGHSPRLFLWRIWRIKFIWLLAFGSARRPPASHYTVLRLMELPLPLPALFSISDLEDTVLVWISHGHTLSLDRE